MITYEQAVHRQATKLLNLPTPPTQVTIDVFAGEETDQDDEPIKYLLIKWLTEDGKRYSRSINLKIETFIREIVEEANSTNSGVM